MKNFSKSKLCWILSFGTTALLCFVIALSMMFGIPQANADTTGETSPTLEIAYDYNKNATFSALKTQLTELGYTATDSFEDTTEVLVGNTYQVTKDSASVTVTIVQPNVTKVEEIVSNTSDVSLGYCDYIRDTWEQTGTHTGTYGANTYGIYSTVTDDDDNYNEYNGNISMSSTYNAPIGMILDNSTKYGLVQFRTKIYKDSWYTFGLMRSASKYVFNYDGNERGGYYLVVRDQQTLIGKEYESKQKQTLQSWKSFKFDDGSNVIFTLGAYPKMVDGVINNVIYFKAEMNDKVAFEYMILDNTPDKIYARPNEDCTKIVLSLHDKSSPYGTPVLLEGVDSPLFTKTEELGDATVGSKVSMVELPEGWSFKDENQEVVYGENSVIVNAPYYDNKTYEVTANINGVYKSTSLTLSYNDYLGKNLSAVSLPTGFAFADADKDSLVLVGEKTYVGTFTENELTTPASITLNVTAPVAQKLESLVNKTSDVSVAIGGSINNSFVDGKIVDDNGVVYITKSEDTNNANNYAGNISMYTSSTKGAGITLMNSAKYGIVQFNIDYYSGNQYTFASQRAHNYNDYGWAPGGAGGYFFYLNRNNASYYGCYQSSSNSTKGYLTTGLPSKIDDGEMMTITYGMYPVIKDGAHATYMYLKCEVGGTQVFVNEYYDTNVSNLYVSSNLANHFLIAVAGSNPVTIEGVDKPLIDGTYNATLNTECVEESELSLIALPNDYAWADNTATNGKVAYGVTDYNATYSFTYNGKDCTIPVIITLSNVKAQARTVAQFYVDGNHITTLSGKVSDSAVLNFVDVQYSISDTVAIGWLAEIDGVKKLYPLDYEWTVIEEANLTFNLATVDFKVYNGASIRTQTTDEYAGGLRFLAMYNSEDMANYQAFIKNAYGVIVPSNDPTYFANGAFTTDALAKNGGDMLKTSAYTYEDVHFASDYSEYGFYTFAISNIKYHNYNRQFAAVNYIVIEYADGTTKDILSNYIERSVYDVAVSTMIDEEHPFEDSYSEDAQATIKGYVANVIELEFDGTELNAYDINDLGLVKPYESITVEYADNNVTLTLTVDAQSILATEEENAYAPVVINDFSSGTSVLKYYQAKLVYNDGTATITFSFN